MKSLFPHSPPVFREWVNSRAFGSLGQHPFFFRKPVVNRGLFNGFMNSQAVSLFCFLTYTLHLPFSEIRLRGLIDMTGIFLYTENGRC
ncbi:hypothetical protein LLG96_07115 [bacterium]|nr:hypothetical protein [bacterium]